MSKPIQVQFVHTEPTFAERSCGEINCWCGDDFEEFFSYLICHCLSQKLVLMALEKSGTHNQVKEFLEPQFMFYHYQIAISNHFVTLYTFALLKTEHKYRVSANSFYRNFFFFEVEICGYFHIVSDITILLCSKCQIPPKMAHSSKNGTFLQNSHIPPKMAHSSKNGTFHSG